MKVVETASTNVGLRLPTWSAMLLIFAGALPWVPSEALGNGGTNIHELASMAGVPNFQIRLPHEDLGGCGRGRYRDPHTRRCRGPGDFGH